MSESLRNDGRIWVPKKPGRVSSAPRATSPRSDRDYYLERKYPSFGNLAPRDISSRTAKEACDDGRGIGPGGLGVYLDFADAIKRLGERDHPRALRQSLPDVREDHRRESLPAADAHLPRRALHHGRPLGGLQPDDQHPRAPRRWARPISPITAPIASAPAPSCRASPTATSSSPPPSATYLAEHRPDGLNTDACGVRQGRRRGQGPHRHACSRSRASAPRSPSTANSARSSGRSAAWPGTRPA